MIPPCFHVNIGGKVLSYTYDEDGNITEIKENDVLKESYSYDDLGQMVRENNLDNNQTILYTYDSSGNIKSKKIYPYTVGAVSGTPETITYSYGNEDWGDLLTAYNGEAITYDEIGNPLKYRSGMTFQWSGGRKLTSFSTPNAVGSYVYNSDGIRVYKEVNGNKTEYYLNGTEIETEITNFGGITRRVDYIYDENGSIYGFVVDNTAKYYYTKNLQGDIIGILDASGTQIVEYSYDAWGKATVSYPNNENLTEAQKQANYLLGSNNPFRYRGYYFDNETGFYYLNSRYYDPEIGRFISVDNQISGVGGDILGYNMFAYCGNNPVNRVDPTGEAWWHWAIGAAIVVGFAAATVVTCGGSLALAAASVGMVASGSAALTTATTVAAAGFIGSATVYGASVMLAASTSETVEEFCDKGNWGTVVNTAFGGVSSAIQAYSYSQPSTPSQPSGKGTQNPNVKNAVQKGQQMHNQMDYGPGVQKEKTITPGNRVDGIDMDNHIIYELKPNNPQAIARGLKQLDRYMQAATQEYGGNWAGVLVLYD